MRVDRLAFSLDGFEELVESGVARDAFLLGEPGEGIGGLLREHEGGADVACVVLRFASSALSVSAP